jgi:hypothetical protein
VELEPECHHLQFHPPLLSPFLLLLPELLVFLLPQLLPRLLQWLLQLLVVFRALLARLWKQCRHGLQLETKPAAVKRMEALLASNVKKNMEWSGHLGLGRGGCGSCGL